jgi:hypothetical protein
VTQPGAANAKIRDDEYACSEGGRAIWLPRPFRPFTRASLGRVGEVVHRRTFATRDVAYSFDQFECVAFEKLHRMAEINEHLNPEPHCADSTTRKPIDGAMIGERLNEGIDIKVTLVDATRQRRLQDG